MNHGSLFSGIGGFDLGFARAGIKTIWDVEIEPYCQAVLRKNFPETEIYSDVKEVGKHNLKPVDIISGGFPCQPTSVAGFRKGSKDDRWLWPEMSRIIKELDPTFVVGENVFGVIELELDNILSDLEALGYTAVALDIPACGASLPTMERHVWIIATTLNLGCEGGEKEAHSDYGNKGQFQGADTGEQNRWDISGTKFRRVCKRVSTKLEPNQRARLMALGNAVPPQIAEIIGNILIGIA